MKLILGGTLMSYKCPQRLHVLIIYLSVILLFLSTLSGCRDSKEADLAWERTVQINTKSAYLAFAEQYPRHPMAKEATALAQDLRIVLVDKAPATLDRRSLEGKVLTFLFVDVMAQWSDVVASGKTDNVLAVFKGDKRSPLKAVLHWSSKDVDFEMKGGMMQMNGGSFIHTEPLREYPGHPVKFPSEEGWFIYKIKAGGKIRLGLFFEGNSDELESLDIFGQLVDVSS